MMFGNTEKKQVRTAPKEIDLEGIKLRIPHRGSMLLIDRVIDIVPDESCTGVKYLNPTESFFPGHFPGRPIMPGVLIIEALAQTAGVLVVEELHGGKPHTDLVYFMAIEKAHFRKPVLPGNELHLKIKKDRQRGHVWRFIGKAYVNDVIVADAIFTAMLASDELTKKDR